MVSMPPAPPPLRLAAVICTVFLGACAGTAERDEEPVAQIPEPAPCVCPAQEPPPPAPNPAPAPVVQPIAAPAPAPAPVAMPVEEPPPGMMFIGEVEYLVLGDDLVRLKARIDTGASTTSLGVQSMETYERDGSRWVRFTLLDPVRETEVTLERPVERTVRIKREDGGTEKRPVVQLEITMGDTRRTREVTLNNRDQFEYPALVGRNFLDGFAVVDVSKKFIALDRPGDESP